MYMTVQMIPTIIPLSGVSVQIRDRDTAQILYATETGADGLTEVISLPAPSRTLSQSSGSPTLPFALYHLDVYREGYRKQTYQNVAVFDGITSIQPAVMIPLPDNERDDSYFPEDGQVFEGSDSTV